MVATRFEPPTATCKNSSAKLVVLRFVEKTFISRWNVEAAQGKHWDLYDFQGTDNVWIIGGGAIFEQLNLIMEYNQMLVSNMI